MALEDFKGKMVSSEGSGGICGIFEWLEELVLKDKGSCEVWEFFGEFGGFLECLERLGPNRNYFLKLRVLLQFLPGAGTAAKFTRRIGGSVQSL
jgi:hypothetical protein